MEAGLEVGGGEAVVAGGGGEVVVGGGEVGGGEAVVAGGGTVVQGIGVEEVTAALTNSVMAALVVLST